MTLPAYDAIIVGAGSVGCPTAYFLSLEGWKVLVLDGNPAQGQGQNKAAIGGVRATHSDPAKITLCLQSIEIFAGWREKHGTDIGWIEGGYCYPVYTAGDETTLRGLLPAQKSYGLDIDWLGPDEIARVVPGINRDGLRGGTLAPGDGQVSPLKAAAAFWKESRDRGAEYRFGEPVTELIISGGAIEGVVTPRGRYYSEVVVNAAGAGGQEIGRMAGIEIPVEPESHEAGITAPMERFLDPLVVDIRPGPEGKTKNFYFGQNDRGQVIFCYTPIEPIAGTDRRCTSEFMPIIARRLIDLIPRFRNMLVRRVWRGLYPQTPDGIIILDRVEEVRGLYLEAGMCGQGFMLGPGVGLNMASLIVHGHPVIDDDIFDSIGFYRDFYATKEALE
ncbi:MAG: FAD-binding oxidoreductase [Candidatus Krumholzibacteriota bacterium]|nr:FAD-binding oxidoreductase [Candidatus Krumholzibacteriota bacterium]